MKYDGWDGMGVGGDRLVGANYCSTRLAFFAVPTEAYSRLASSLLAPPSLRL